MMIFLFSFLFHQFSKYLIIVIIIIIIIMTIIFTIILLLSLFNLFNRRASAAAEYPSFSPSPSFHHSSILLVHAPRKNLEPKQRIGRIVGILSKESSRSVSVRGWCHGSVCSLPRFSRALFSVLLFSVPYQDEGKGTRIRHLPFAICHYMRTLL